MQNLVTPQRRQTRNVGRGYQGGSSHGQVGPSREWALQTEASLSSQSTETPGQFLGGKEETGLLKKEDGEDWQKR